MINKKKVIFCLSYLEIETTISLASQGDAVIVTSRPEILSFFLEKANWECILFEKEDVYIRDLIRLLKKRSDIYSIVNALLDRIDQITQHSIDVYLSAPIAGEVVWCVIEKLSSRKKMTLHFSREFSIKSKFLKNISFFNVKHSLLVFLKRWIFYVPMIFKTDGKNLFTMLDVESWNVKKKDYDVFPVSDFLIKSFIGKLHSLVGLEKALLYLPPVGSINVDAADELALFRGIYDFCSASGVRILIKEHPQYSSIIKDYDAQFPGVLVVDSRVPAKMILRVVAGIVSYSTYALVEGSYLGKCSISLIYCLQNPSLSLLNFKLYLDEKQLEENPILYPNSIDSLTNVMLQRLL